MKTVKTRVHPQALESLKRYKSDVKAGHKDAAEYWRGQAGAYFTANPIDKGRIDWMPRLKKWRVIQYVGRKDVKVGDYSTKERATEILRQKVSSRKNPILESLASGAAIGIGFAAGGKIMDKIAKNPKRRISKKLKPKGSKTKQKARR